MDVSLFLIVESGRNIQKQIIKRSFIEVIP